MQTTSVAEADGALDALESLVRIVTEGEFVARVVSVATVDPLPGVVAGVGVDAFAAAGVYVAFGSGCGGTRLVGDSTRVEPVIPVTAVTAVSDEVALSDLL